MHHVHVECYVIALFQIVNKSYWYNWPHKHIYISPIKTQRWSKHTWNWESTVDAVSYKIHNPNGFAVGRSKEACKEYIHRVQFAHPLAPYNSIPVFTMCTSRIATWAQTKYFNGEPLQCYTTIIQRKKREFGNSSHTTKCFQRFPVPAKV